MAETAQHYRCVGDSTQSQLYLSRPKANFAPTSQPRPAERERTEAAQPHADPFFWQPKTEAMAQGQTSRIYQAMPREPVPFALTTYGSYNRVTPGYSQSGTARTNRDGFLGWRTGSTHQPAIVSGSEYRGFPAGGISYGGDVTEQDLCRKGAAEGYSAPGWIADMNILGGTHGVFNGSDASTDLSVESPTSLFSELSEQDKQSSEMKFDESSPPSTWAGNETASYPSLGRPQSFENSMACLGFNAGHIQPSQVAGGIETDFTGLPCWRFGMSTPSFGQDRTQGFTAIPQMSFESFDWNHDLAGGRPHGEVLLPQSLPSMPWNSVGQLLHEPAVGYAEMEQARDTSHTHDLSDGSEIYADGAPNSSGEHPALNGTLAVHSDMQLTVPATRLRKMEDQILLEGKRSGLTYKEIRKKMQTRVAESTLRGRYRSLTKARKDRVRKPVWTANDVRLLREIVRSELDRLDDASYRHSSKDQRFSKLSWKRVGDYIADNGGSYHFGNSTCKKKWAELEHTMVSDDEAAR